MREKPIFKKVIGFAEAKQLLEQIRENRGYPSGYEDLDRLCGGLVKDGVTLIAGRPAMGKTSLALNIVNRVAQEEGGTILILSSRAWPEEFSARLFSIGTGLKMEQLFNHELPQTTVMKQFSDFYGAKKSRIKFEIDSFLTLDEIWEHCSMISDLRLVVIDPGEEIYKPIDYSAKPIDWNVKREEPAVIFHYLQKLAQTLEVPVICTSHLHRSLERRKNKRPRLGDLKKVDIDPAWPDQIIFLYRDRYYDSKGEAGAEWIVAKAPNDRTGTVQLDWDYTTGRFPERK